MHTNLGHLVCFFRPCNTSSAPPLLRQALSFLLLGSFGVALLVLASASVPISEPMILRGDHLIWILWLVRGTKGPSSELCLGKTLEIYASLVW